MLLYLHYLQVHLIGACRSSAILHSLWSAETFNCFIFNLHKRPILIFFHILDIAASNNKIHAQGREVTLYTF